MVVRQLLTVGARVCCALLVAAGMAAAGAQSFGSNDPDSYYTDLWERGQYREALAQLEEMLKAAEGYVPVALQQHHAELLFECGRVEEAIAQMEKVADDNPEPAFTLALALMYQYMGRKQNYERSLHHAEGQLRRDMWRYSRRRDENYVAMGRIYELLGHNPKTLLSRIYDPLIEDKPDVAGIRVGAGDLAYRRAAYDIAAGHYTKALEQEPKNQDALAGLAECYWKSHDERLPEAMQRLRAINPHHPRARAIEVEQLLDGAKADEALGLIGEALEINPVSVRFRSLQAAAQFIKNDPESVERIQQEVLAFNPETSEPYRTAGRIASRQYRFQEGAAFQKAALAVDPNDYEARALYTLDLLRLGQEDIGTAELEAAFESDPFNVQLYNLITLMDTLKKFTTIDRGGFTLRLPEHEAALVSDDALDLLDEALTKYEAKYEVEVAKPVLVEMFNRHDDFMVRSVGLPGNVGHLGICFGQLVTLDSPSARPRGSWNWRSVLWHEFVHVITLQKTKNRMPRWLSEGISVHEEQAYSPALSMKLDPDYRAVIAGDGLPAVRDLGLLFTGPKSPTHLMFGYFASGEFVGHYVDTQGTAPLNAALTAIGEGAEAVEALAKAAGVTIHDLDTAFEVHMAERTKPYEALPAMAKVEKEPEGIVEKLMERVKGPKAETKQDSPFTNAMDRGAEALENKDWNEAEAAYTEAHRLFPDYEGPDAPLKRLALVYRESGNDDKYRATLKRIVESAPAELEACTELLAIASSKGDWAETVRVAHWALGIDPYDVALHKTYVEALTKTGEEDKALGSLAVLAQLDKPHAPEHRLHRAEIYAGLGRFGLARKEVLAVLEQSPHYWKAQSLLLDIVEREGGGAAPRGETVN